MFHIIRFTPGSSQERGAGFLSPCLTFFETQLLVKGGKGSGIILRTGTSPRCFSVAATGPCSAGAGTEEAASLALAFDFKAKPRYGGAPCQGPCLLLTFLASRELLVSALSLLGPAVAPCTPAASLGHAAGLVPLLAWQGCPGAGCDPLHSGDAGVHGSKEPGCSSRDEASSHHGLCPSRAQIS